VERVVVSAGVARVLVIVGGMELVAIDVFVPGPAVHGTFARHAHHRAADGTYDGAYGAACRRPDGQRRPSVFAAAFTVTFPP